MEWVAFVRNVMVGREGLTRQRLLDVAQEAGADGARSVITTGNLRLSCDCADADDLARRLETGVSRVIGRYEMVAVRPLHWLTDLLAGEPFDDFGTPEWSTEVALLRHDAPVLDVTRLEGAQRTVVVAVLEREVLAARPVHGARRPHVNRLTERAAGVPATSRGWSTLLRVAGG